jgi:hypothetical protein
LIPHGGNAETKPVELVVGWGDDGESHWKKAKQTGLTEPDRGEDRLPPGSPARVEWKESMAGFTGFTKFWEEEKKAETLKS